ncbi:MAG: hypothetical protein ACI9ND_002620 [Yoonia sp.]
MHGQAPSTSPHGFVWLPIPLSADCSAITCRAMGGKILSSRTRRSSNRAAALLRLAAVTTGRSDTALGAFYRRLAARAGNAKAVTATARKIAVLLYNTLRHAMTYKDPSASHYEERYRDRVLGNLKRCAKSFGYDLQELPTEADLELRPVFRTFCLLTLRGHFPSHIFESLFWRFVADA